MPRDPHLSADRFERFCVVGLGNHAKTKLIPALLANGQSIAGLVTSQCTPDLPSAPRFARIEEAVASLPRDTAFLIATPPDLHFTMAMAALEAGRNVIVEKPAFVTRNDTAAAFAAAERTGAVLVEAFMHRHTRLYRRLLEIWARERAQMVGLAARFEVPAMPKGTFRQGARLSSSGLYDIGCYALSLLVDLGLPLDSLEIERVDFAGDPEREAVSIGGYAGGLEIAVRAGVGASYVNSVRLAKADAAEIVLSPVFYGRPGERILARMAHGKVERETIAEGDAFAAMLAVPRSVWRQSQPQRAGSAAVVAAALERLAVTLSRHRARATPGASRV